MKSIYKKIIVLAFVFGVLGGLTEYFSPSIKVDENSILVPKESMEASGLAPILSAKGAILIDAGDGSVIYEKDADRKLYPASTTKIMTALIVIEMLTEIDANLESKIVVPAKAVGVEGSSIYLKEGEVITVEELLYGTLLQSGNDAATALAVCFGGNEDNFVKKMNAKARALNCKNTNFINPSGLFHENHYTTARDLARIAQAAMKNNTFRQIVGTKQWISESSGRIINNKNKTIEEYEGATGIKIGYTKKSGRTLVASAQREGKEFIAVVLDDPDWFQDAYSMMDYGFHRE